MIASLEKTFGTFRFPPNSCTAPTGLGYRVETQAGGLYLTGRNGQGVENGIEHAQIPPALMAVDSTLFVSDTAFDLFRFTLVAPATGRGTVSVTNTARKRAM